MRTLASNWPEVPIRHENEPRNRISNLEIEFRTSKSNFEPRNRISNLEIEFRTSKSNFEPRNRSSTSKPEIKTQNRT